MINPSKQAMKQWRNAARQFLAAHNDMSNYKGAVGLDLEFVFRRPDSHYKRNLRGDDTRLKASAPRTHTKKPDLDNLVKFIGDCLNKLAYHDDSQITHLRVSKRWSHTKEFTKVTIKYFNAKK